jgi:phenylacetate-CoA ligase
MTELVAAGSECEAGGLHLWPEVGILEVLDDETDKPLAAGRVGRLVCTALLNTDMPLIRYDVGDRGALASQAGMCPCGRSLPRLQEMDGRSDDLILTADGRRIGRAALDAVLQADLAIVEAQFVQESWQRLSVRFVPASGYTNRHGREVARRLRERVGDMEIELEPVDHIPRSPTGKLRGVISKLAPSDEASVTGE